MKFRNDFVTNSSSSSFIIATKEDVNEDTFLELLGNKYDKAILTILYEYGDYLDIEDELSMAIAEEDEEAMLEYGKNHLVEELMWFVRECDLTLDSWKATSCEVSSESDNFLEIFLYEIGNLESENFKAYNSGM